MSSAGPPPTHPKRSFLRLPVSIDVERLLVDYASIPALAWATSHFDAHCSSDTLLLRGGVTGTKEDFVATQSHNHEILAIAPYLAWLIGEAGPFGGATYAFLFRMKPTGVARPHIDEAPAWQEPLRVHVPITTNDDAFLLCRGRAKHLAVGEAWTFDNQAMHAAVNGATVRAHLIMDVGRNPKMEALLANATWDPGAEDPLRWLSACLPNRPPILEPASALPLSLAEKADLELPAEGFAARVHTLQATARPRDYPLRIGDILVSVDGVTECPVARTALDYVSLCHAPGDDVRIELIRGRERKVVRLRLTGETANTDQASAEMSRSGRTT
jgi:Aspartyl/Asparaginyl beta-hydroxylase